MIIQGLKPAYQHYLEFANISTTPDLKRMGIMAEKKIAANKTSYNSNTSWKPNHQPKNAKATSFSSQETSKGAEVSAVNKYKKYTPLAIAYTEALERLLEKGLVRLPEIKPEPEIKSKNWDGAKHCKYHRARGHNTEDCWVFKNWLEGKIQSNDLPIPVKKAQQ